MIKTCLELVKFIVSHILRETNIFVDPLVFVKTFSLIRKVFLIVGFINLMRSLVWSHLIHLYIIFLFYNILRCCKWLVLFLIGITGFNNDAFEPSLVKKSHASFMWDCVEYKISLWIQLSKSFRLKEGMMNR